MKTPIADMIAEMLARGADHEAIVIAARSMEMSRTVPDIVPDIRAIIREYERTKKQNQRANSTGRQAKANDVAARNNPEIVPDTDGKRCNSNTTPSRGYQEGKEEKKERYNVTRGTRLSADAKFPDEWRRWAIDAGLAAPDPSWAEFVDYWSAVPGQRGCKLNWFATWRNRVRDLVKKIGGGNGSFRVVAGKDERRDKFQRAYDQLGESIANDERSQEGRPAYPRLLSSK